MAETSPTTLRKLSLHERYCLARSNVGMAPQLCALASVRVDAADDGAEWSARIAERIERLLAAVPALSCYVPDAAAAFPHFAWRRTMGLHDVLLPSDPELDAAVSATADEQRHAMLQTRLIEWQCKHLVVTADKPLWHVRIVRADEHTLTIALMMHHLLADGRSLINLLSCLVAPKGQDDDDDEVWSPTRLAGTLALLDDRRLPPRSEDVMPHARASSMLVLARLLLREVVLPMLPRFVQRWFGVHVVWPARSKASAYSDDAATSEHVILLRGGATTAPVLPRMRAHCVEQGRVASIHPALHTACMLSLRAAVHPAYMRTDTPVSMRNEREHGRVAGNFVGVLAYPIRSPSDDDGVWALTRTYADRLTSPAGHVAAQHIWALLPLLFTDAKAKSYKPTPDAPTPWEAFLQQRLRGARSGKAVLGSLELSNVGMLAPVDRQVTAVSWTQHRSALAGAVNVNVLRWRGEDGDDGLALTVSMRKGVFMTPDQERRFVAHLRASVTLLLGGKWSSDMIALELDALVDVEKDE